MLVIGMKFNDYRRLSNLLPIYFKRTCEMKEIIPARIKVRAFSLKVPSFGSKICKKQAVGKVDKINRYNRN